MSQCTGPWNARLLTVLLLKCHCLYVHLVNSTLCAIETKHKYIVSFLFSCVRLCSWRSCWPSVTLFLLSGMQALERVRWWGHCKRLIKTWNANLYGWTLTQKLWPMTSCSASSTQQPENGKMVITEYGNCLVVSVHRVYCAMFKHLLTGLFSNIMRELANISHSGPKWIVLDGDIDPMWIESLNTVMDDNKVWW